jgi:hypothetical protein
MNEALKRKKVGRKAGHGVQSGRRGGLVIVNKRRE